MQPPVSLAGLSQKEIEKLLPNLPVFRSKQIYKWILRGACSFDKMTDIPAAIQNDLNRHFNIFSGAVTACHEDTSTKKIVIRLKDNAKIEAVLLNDGKNRLTACISTQAGCPAGCVFCKTGSLGFKRNLESTEIVEQYLHLLGSAAAAGKKKDEHIIGNIVIMGMGEPLLNLANLRKAIEVFTDPAGLNLSKRRITVSTCGICDSLFDIAQNGPFMRLALSLTTADETLRQKLMPITKNNPLEKIKEALKLFQDNSGGRITLEIPLLGGINTRDIDAASIADFAKGLETVINIIPWNPADVPAFENKSLCKPEKKETANFISLLEKQGLKVTMRLHKGQKINGACGQLGSLA